MQSGRLNERTVTDIVRLTSSGAATAEVIVRACLDRIEAREPDVRAWAFLDADQAIAQARDVDRRAGHGALRGVPVAAKDIIATVDMPTAYGSPIYAGHRPAWDAACIAAIRAAGGIILGKTVTTEFASSYPGKTVHPLDPTRTPGGSSSGSAAAVADDMVPLAIGTQTGGSVIRPASFCGVVGYKPSFGWVNRHGVKPLSESLDTVGGMGRTVDDAARLVSVMAGRPALLVLPEVRGPRIAVWQSETLRQAEPDMLACLEDVATTLSGRGAKVSDVTPPAIFADLDAAHHEIEYFEMGKALAFELSAHRDQMSAPLQKRVVAGQACTPELYDEKHRVAREGRSALLPMFADFDVILTPAALGEAPKGHASTGNALFNRIWTLLYGPAVTIPAGRGRNGMPLGLQLIGPRNDDFRTLAIAKWVEAILRP
jgi:amidase